jgi:hypothetical protein
MTRVPATIGVCAIILLGLAMSACAGGGAAITAPMVAAGPASASGQRQGQRRTRSRLMKTFNSELRHGAD